MSWGAWEGQRLDDLRLQLGDRMTALEARGWTSGRRGESPREVQQRVAPWLTAMAARGRNVAAVSHKGVIRAVMAQATGWPMIGKPPHRLARNAAHLFKVAPDGTVAVHHLNLMLS
ncbi:histidine phosphatase family protein [Tistrella bauzanensis]